MKRTAMRIALVTDAWMPQVNGVVRTLSEMTQRLLAEGHELLIISPDDYISVPCPSYPEIRLALASRASVGRRLEAFGPDAVHIATEGPLGLRARRHCIASQMPFTTAYHTQFPDYVARRTRLPAKYFWPYIRRFHGASQAVLVSTQSVRQQLREQGISHVRHWGRGVDLEAFHPAAAVPDILETMPGPVQLYVGRVAVEKNIEGFLRTSHPGSKVVVGDGPARLALAREFPGVHFVGSKSGEELAGYYAAADVFAFPSRTDTFGLVMIEALACGTPVAAFPVQGPMDVLTSSTGAMDDDLEQAIASALKLDSVKCVEHAASFSWDKSVRQFLDALALIPENTAIAA